MQKYGIQLGFASILTGRKELLSLLFSFLIKVLRKIKTEVEYEKRR
jgi:hypothetical protein